MFGWSYPAGCTGTPYDDDAPETCPCCGGANWNEDGGVEIDKQNFPYYRGGSTPGYELITLETSP